MGPVELEGLRKDYERIQPALSTVCEDMKSWLRDAATRLKLSKPRIEGRVKDPASFIKKCLRRSLDGRPWKNPLADASDKIGVRADLVYSDDIDRVLEMVENTTDAFEVLKIDDKRTQLHADRLGYVGVHIDIIPTLRPASLKAEFSRCEIQVRTNAQAAWAMAAHPLVYKPALGVAAEQERRVLRLTALLELFDEQVAEARRWMMSDEGYPTAIIAEAVEAAQMRFVITEPDRSLTYHIIDTIVDCPDAQTAHDLTSRLDTFVNDNEGKIRAIVGREGLGSGSSQVLLAQPEAILVFMLLDQDRYVLQERWKRSQLGHRFLEDLAVTWGTPLPLPN